MPSNAPAFRNHKFSFAKGELGLHENLMTCVIVGCKGQVLVSDDREQTEAYAICIKPDVIHRVVIPEGGAEIVYLDGVQQVANAPKFGELPEAWQGLPKAIQTRDHIALAAYRKLLNRNDTPSDAGVMRIVERLYKDPFERLSQLDLAHALQLERTLAMRHFKSTTGQTFRKFKIWAAMMCAVDAAYNGEKIGLAGIQAGFSDAAHLTRTASTLFGITPTQGLSGLRGFTTITANPNPDV